MKKLRVIKIFGGDDGYVQLALDYRHAINDVELKRLVESEPSDIVDSGKKLVDEFEYLSNERWILVTHILQKCDIKYNFKNKEYN